MSDHAFPVDAPSLLRDGGTDHDGATHRGMLAGACLVVARRAGDPRIPPTSLAIGFGSGPGPGAGAARRLDALRTAVSITGPDGRTTAEGTVELAGFDVAPRVPDLAELGRGRLPAVADGPTRARCWGCGDDGLLQCRPRAAGRSVGDAVIATWAADERGMSGDGYVDAAVVVALSTCPATWLAGGRPPEHLVVRFFGRPAAYAPLRFVARRDASEAGTVRARVALLDDDGAVVAVAATTHPA